ncbi:hypothetical protein QBC36DRAFT_362109, partial [Triangularia setosa]
GNIKTSTTRPLNLDLTHLVHIIIYCQSQSDQMHVTALLTLFGSTLPLLALASPPTSLPTPTPTSTLHARQPPNNNADRFAPAYTTCRSLVDEFMASAPTASILVEYWSLNVTVQETADPYQVQKEMCIAIWNKKESETPPVDIASAYYSFDSEMSSWAATAKTEALSLKERCETAHPLAAGDAMFMVAGSAEECVQAMRLNWGPEGAVAMATRSEGVTGGQGGRAPTGITTQTGAPESAATRKIIRGAGWAVVLVVGVAGVVGL